MYNVPYHANPDETHCVQAVFRMVIEYFTGEVKSWEELDRMTRKSPDKGTWLFPALVAFVRHGFAVVNIEPMDYRRFLDEGEEYLYEIMSPEAAEWYLAHSNLKEVSDDIPAFLETVHHEVREPTFDDIEHYLSNGYLVSCDVNARTLYGESGFSSHLVLVVGMDDAYLYINDPDVTDGKQWPVARATFAAALDETSANLTAFCNTRDTTQ